MKNQFTLEWDALALAKAFNVSEEDIKEYFTDGRRVSFIIERRLKAENAGWSLAKSEGAGYDLSDPKGRKWEVRSITAGGVYFTPSNQVGSGRKFSEEGFMGKLREISGFILSDITLFPRTNCYLVPVENVLRWHRDKRLGSNAKVSRKKFIDELLPDIVV